MHRLRRTLAAIVIIASPLTGCSSGDPGSGPDSTTGDTGAADTTTTSSAPAATTPSSSASSDVTTSSAPPSSGPGCESGDDTIPDGAATGEIVDVDGDGEPDTVWMLDRDGRTTIGISTAAGGGSRIDHESASPIPRRVLVVDADEKPPVELIVSDGRGAALHAFVDWEIQPVLNPEGEPYEFDLQNPRGDGTGIGGVETDDGRRLVGLQAGERGEFTVKWSRTIIELDGLTAANGRTETGTYDLPDQQEEADLLDEITCGDLTMTDDGVGTTRG